MNRAPFVCSSCGYQTPRWMGRCPDCGVFDGFTQIEEAAAKNTGQDLLKAKFSAENSDSADKNTPKSQSKLPTGNNEVDRVLGGGWFPGSMVLFGGNPGIGKSTLALQLWSMIPQALYFSGEESVGQIQHRAQRLSSSAVDLESAASRIISTHRLEDIITTIETHRPPLAVIDSIQMVAMNGDLGGISQLKSRAEVLQKVAKSTGTTLLVIGHVTKSDELAGPRLLEHLVDIVLYLEGVPQQELRLLRTTKNRFGSTLEIGVFQMEESGLSIVQNPSEWFLSERLAEASGSAIASVREGGRSFLIEVQALTQRHPFGAPRRTTQGFDLGRWQVLLAVVAKFTPWSCQEFEAYLNVIGGLKVQDPAADLGVVAALISSRLNQGIPADTVFIGEVGLSGEVRQVGQIKARLQEIAKMGFRRVLGPRQLEEFRGKMEGVTLEPLRRIQDMPKILWKK